jgi:hypothetical protein
LLTAIETILTDCENEFCKVCAIILGGAPMRHRLPQARHIVRGINVIKFWTNCCEAMRFTCEARAVISARLMLFASGDPKAVVEAGLTISEKVMALAAAQAAAERALADGLGVYEAAEQAYLPLRHRVRVNSERLRTITH